MSWRRKRARPDRNQPALIKDLEALGMSVVDLSGVGRGCPDLLVGWKNVSLLVEVKDPMQPRRKRDLRDSQKTFFAEWQGGEAIRAETAVDVLDWFCLNGHVLEKDVRNARLTLGVLGA